MGKYRTQKVGWSRLGCSLLIMANEIQISAVTGLTIGIQLYQGTSTVGTPFPATEIGVTGEYVASMPTVPAGRYMVLATTGVDVKIGSGEILWTGTEELIVGIGLNTEEITVLINNLSSASSIDTKQLKNLIIASM